METETIRCAWCQRNKSNVGAVVLKTTPRVKFVGRRVVRKARPIICADCSHKINA